MNDFVNANMSEYWNGDGGENWVSFQDRMNVSLMPFGNKAIEAAALSSDENVLDIGCGCGDTSFEIVRQIGSLGYVQGVDISDVILQRARRRQAMFAEQHNISFERADAQCHHFKLMVFDVVFSRFGVMFFDDPAAAFSNIRQALKPEGRLAFVCWQPIKNNKWVRLPLDVVKNHMPLPTPPGSEEPGPFSFGELDRVHRILASAGFSDVEIKKFEAPFNIGADLDEAVTFLTHIGPASSAIEASDVDDTKRARIVTELRDTLAPYKTEHGVILGAATWIVTARNP